MTEFKFMQDCPICDEPYQHGPKIYEGEYLPSYELAVCQRCAGANFDGWSPHLEPKLIANLKAKGLPLPPRLPNKLLPPA